MVERKWEPDELWLAIKNCGQGQEGDMQKLCLGVARAAVVNSLVEAAFNTRDKGAEALCTAVIALAERQHELEKRLIEAITRRNPPMIQVNATDLTPEFHEMLKNKKVTVE